MSDNFTQPNRALEEQIAACRNSNEIRDVLLHYQELNALPTKYDRVALPSREWAAPESAEAPKVNAEAMFRRDVTMADGSVKTVTAYSTSGLDFLERTLLGKRI
jgi:hypothetical protein